MISLERLINKTEIFEKESFFAHILVIDQKVYCSNLFYTIQLFHSANGMIVAVINNMNQRCR